jgi:nitrous oxidase accessory protein NosD
MRDARFGVHEMFTSDALVANNTVRDQDVGIIVMTRPTGNVVVGNDVRDSGQGINVVVSASFVSENLVARNGIGVSIGSHRSYYARNTVVGNDVGLRDDTLLPTNVVTLNDVVANRRPVDVGGGTRNVWAHRGRGNYWGPVPGLDRDGDGVVDRAYRPADRVDEAAARSAGARTLSRAPALSSIRGFQSALPGLRGSSLVDPAPLSRPVRPGALRPLVDPERRSGG